MLARFTRHVRLRWSKAKLGDIVQMASEQPRTLPPFDLFPCLQMCKEGAAVVVFSSFTSALCRVDMGEIRSRRWAANRGWGMGEGFYYHAIKEEL